MTLVEKLEKTAKVLSAHGCHPDSNYGYAVAENKKLLREAAKRLRELGEE